MEFLIMKIIRGRRLGPYSGEQLANKKDLARHDLLVTKSTIQSPPFIFLVYISIATKNFGLSGCFSEKVQVLSKSPCPVCKNRQALLLFETLITQWATFP